MSKEFLFSVSRCHEDVFVQSGSGGKGIEAVEFRIDQFGAVNVNMEVSTKC